MQKAANYSILFLNPWQQCPSDGVVSCVVIGRCVEMSEWGRSRKYQIQAKWLIGIHNPQHPSSKSTLNWRRLEIMRFFFSLTDFAYNKVNPIPIDIDLIAPANIMQVCLSLFPTWTQLNVIGSECHSHQMSTVGLSTRIDDVEPYNSSIRSLRIDIHAKANSFWAHVSWRGPDPS